MPARIVIGPVVLVDGCRCPKVSTILDPGKPTLPGLDVDGNPHEPATLVHSSIISDGNGVPGQRDDICLSLVGGIDLSDLDKDREITSLFAVADTMLSNIQSALQKTPKQMSWSEGKKSKLRSRVKSHGAKTEELTDDTPMYEWANRVAASIIGGDVRELKTSRVGA